MPTDKEVKTKPWLESISITFYEANDEENCKYTPEKVLAE